MSRDLIVQDIPSTARSVSDIPDDWVPSPLPFGRRAVVDAVREVAPTAGFSNPRWGHIDLPGVSIEVTVNDDDPLESFVFHVRASDPAAADEILRAILSQLGVRAFDTDSLGGIFS